jgi:gluconate kinase
MLYREGQVFQEHQERMAKTATQRLTISLEVFWLDTVSRLTVQFVEMERHNSGMVIHCSTLKGMKKPTTRIWVYSSNISSS